MTKDKVRFISGIILAAVVLIVAVGGLVFRLNKFKIVFSEPTGITETVEYGGEYAEPEVKAYLKGRFFLKSGKELKVKESGNVDTSSLGSYDVSWSASIAGIKGNCVRTVKVVDTTPPVITVMPYSKKVLYTDELYIEPGCKAADLVDGDVTAKVKASKIDTSKPGEKTITYTVTDECGNTATATRKITVKQRPKTAVVNAPATNKKGGVIYLTFDDGPSAYTPHLLDVLAKYNVKATFFVTGSGNRAILAREAREGHTVAIHSLTHNYSKIYSSEAAFWADMDAMNAIIKAQTGSYSKLLRFPGGSSNTVSRKFKNGIMTTLTNSVIKKGYKYFDWNVYSGDAGGTTNTDKVYANVINGVRGKAYSIVLQHDIKAFSVNAVEKIVIWGINNGYTFAPLTENSPTIHQRVNN